MGAILDQESAAFLIGVISGDKKFLGHCDSEFPQFGEIVLTSPVWDFDFTRYYEKEMGPRLARRFFLFSPGFPMEDLAPIKIRTNRLEEELIPHTNLDVKRPVNIDPGYLTLSRLVLASTKNHSHRIFLSQGIYAEITLHYQNGSYRSRPWTFPDYASQKYVDFFNDARQKLFG
jgi:hypothetical protein